ncbi:hypothetical protein EYF80_022364 [Liparis tanakae]|uniref:Uncharacterized protein n=1 Tax=Liparis tanakae TaxID=230148 RepID=A0A4Z2HNK0_9TELE|nr:hypothetical protein EYF80_022364 [Liparis tanakae]
MRFDTKGQDARRPREKGRTRPRAPEARWDCGTPGISPGSSPGLLASSPSEAPRHEPPPAEARDAPRIVPGMGGSSGHLRHTFLFTLLSIRGQRKDQPGAAQRAEAAQWSLVSHLAAAVTQCRQRATMITKKQPQGGPGTCRRPQTQPGPKDPMRREVTKTPGRKRVMERSIVSNHRLSHYELLPGETLRDSQRLSETLTVAASFPVYSVLCHLAEDEDIAALTEGQGRRLSPERRTGLLARYEARQRERHKFVILAAFLNKVISGGTAHELKDQAEHPQSSCITRSPTRINTARDSCRRSNRIQRAHGMPKSD